MSANFHSFSKSSHPVVVLGGLGFIGSHICRRLVAAGYAVRIFDKLYASHKLVEDIEGEIEIIEGDISRPHDVLNVIANADTLIHLVHTTVPGSSMDDPAYDLNSNVAASANWLKSLSETELRRILFVSSGGTVYGIPRTNPISEDHPTNPINSYGITKLAIEKYMLMYSSMFNIECRVLRPSNVYGPGQRLGIGQGVIGVLADRALRAEPLEIWGTGENLRDYLYVEDMVTATMALLNYNGRHQIFNISSGKGRSVLDIVAILHDQLGYLPEVVYKPERGFDVDVNVLDSSLLRVETGWHPLVDLAEGIGRTLQCMKGTSASAS